MIKQRRTVTRRVSIRTETSLVEVWENSDGEIVEFHRHNGQLQQIKPIKCTFEECVNSHKASGHKLLVSRQSLDQGEVTFAA